MRRDADLRGRVAQEAREHREVLGDSGQVRRRDDLVRPAGLREQDPGRADEVVGDRPAGDGIRPIVSGR